MPQRLPLLDQRLYQSRMAVPQCIDRNAASQVDILSILLIPQPGAQAPNRY